MAVFLCDTWSLSLLAWRMKAKPIPPPSIPIPLAGFFSLHRVSEAAQRPRGDFEGPTDPEQCWSCPPDLTVQQ